jgi:two-component system OmpR family sensor kinase
MSDPADPTPWSLERRINRRMLATLSVVWLLGSAVALWGVWSETGKVLDGALAQTAERLLALPDFALRERRHEALHPGVSTGEGHIAYQVFDGQRRLRLRSQAAPEHALDPDWSDGLRDVHGWHVLTLTRADRGRKVQVAETVTHRFEVIWRSVGWLLGTLLFLLPAASVALTWVLRKGFGALEPSRADLLIRPSGDLKPVSVDGVPDELQPWVLAVNALIDQVRAMLDSERAFAAQATHELRTPLAAARAKAQRLVEISSDENARQHARALMRQLDRLTRLASRLLQLARIESGVALRREPVDLMVLVKMVVEEFGDAAERERLRVEVRGTPPPVLGDVDAIGIALRNLIDNALKHGGDKAWVTVSVNDGAIAVIDDGPGVSAASLDKLVRPFERGLTAAEGSGLGLSIVSAIARQCGGRLELRSPIAAGRGFAAKLDFREIDEARDGFRRAGEALVME